MSQPTGTLLATARLWMLILMLAIGSMMENSGHAQDRPLESIRTEEFLKLTENAHVLYVAGILDGMSYVSYGNAEPTLGAWTNCVRRKNLGDTTREVVEWLKKNPEVQRDPVPWAVAKVIGARNCPR